MSTISIDGIDKTILRSLMKDARTPVLEIARNVGISWSNTYLEAFAEKGLPFLAF